jgi:D-alanyl-lipoteichoic acid acyltransferase DltB (MBOAT superfamily)
MKYITAFDVSTTTGAWNIQVHYWMKYYCMIRLLDKKKRGFQAWPSLVTFIVSAIWHGLGLGFYYFFIAAFFV